MPVPLAWWRALGSSALDLVYPPQCQGCEAFPEAAHAPEPSTLDRLLCRCCQRELRPCQDPCCRICGEPFLTAAENGQDFECQTCSGRKFAFEYAVAPYLSRGVMRDLIHRFKYQRQIFLRPLLGRLLVEALERPRLQEDLAPGWFAVPVPLHPRRFREREFNQAMELCRELKRRRRVPILNALRRTRYTSSQTRFRRDQRIANLRDAFVVSPRQGRMLPGSTVALVDDVFTTGSTANECARVLRAAGAKKVVVITLARG